MEMLKALRQLATQKRLTIAAVIHQPSWQLAQMFDSVVVLAKGGRTVYLGPTVDVQPYFTELGFHFPPGYNPVDVALDCVSGTIISDKENVTSASLPEIWRDKTEGPIDIIIDRVERGEDDHSLVTINSEDGVGDVPPPAEDVPEEELLPAAVGNVRTAVLLMFLTMFLPPLFVLPYYNINIGFPWRTQRNQYYTVIGFFFGSGLYLYFSIGMMVGGSTNFVLLLMVGSMFGSFQLLLGLISIGILIYRWRRGRSMSSVAHFCTGCFLAPAMLFFLPFLRERSLYLAIAGIGAGSFFLGQSLGTSYLIDRNMLISEIQYVMVSASGLVLIAVARSRLKRIISSERRTTGFLVQTWLQFQRAAVQQSRDIFGIAFDLFLPLFTGLSVGVLFFGKEWQPPSIEYSSWANNATVCLACTNMTAMDENPADAAVCHLLYLNNDPYPQLSLMSTMGLGLVAAASALRLFGANKANFLREKNAGISSEAYFIGRSLFHIMTSAAATAFFVIPFYWLVHPHANFWVLYAVFFVIYQCCAGVALFWSIVVDSSLASLLSILTILAFVLFGGSLFATGVNFPEHVLQIILFLPSYLSPLRWSYELFFLVMMQPYREYLVDPDLTYALVQYGFTYDHYYTCWTTLALMVYVLRVVLPFCAIVLQEKK